MKKTIEIEKKPYSVEKYYSGIYTKDKKEYSFTIIVTDTDGTDLSYSVGWAEEPPYIQPATLQDVEDAIIEQL